MLWITLTPSTAFSFSSVIAGADPSLNRCGHRQLHCCIRHRPISCLASAVFMEFTDGIHSVFKPRIRIRRSMFAAVCLIAESSNFKDRRAHARRDSNGRAALAQFHVQDAVVFGVVHRAVDHVYTGRQDAVLQQRQ